MDVALNGLEDPAMTSPPGNLYNHAHFCTIAKELDEREHLILVNRVLGTMSLSDIADALGVTAERVRQIEIRLKVKVRSRLFAGLDRVACVCHSN